MGGSGTLVSALDPFDAPVRKHGAAACSTFYFAKGAFHDSPSETHDRRHAGAESFAAHTDFLCATRFRCLLGLETSAANFVSSSRWGGLRTNVNRMGREGAIGRISFAWPKATGAGTAPGISGFGRCP